MAEKFFEERKDQSEVKARIVAKYLAGDLPVDLTAKE